MRQRLVLHIVDADGRRRAQLVRLAHALGHHVEAYAGWAELAVGPPRTGIVLARDTPEALDAAASLALAGCWLPLVLCDARPTTARVVEAIKSGALDFIDWPCTGERLDEALARAADEAAGRLRRRERIDRARERIAALSRRERQVLEGVARGTSNKQMARALGISPRTVEIHRAHMMAKLAARHNAHAVRLWLEAESEEGAFTSRP